ncbi:MAG: 16S rRNA (cytidine(1402)-2'-O)-methyltransferase [Gemmobacter sp.]
MPARPPRPPRTSRPGTAARSAAGRSDQEGPPDEPGRAQGAPLADAGAAAGRAIEPALHFIATPIGAARDITLRALDLLAGADVLAAEDTRSLRHLMDIHGVALAGRPLVAYHDHNGAAVRPRLLAALAEGRSVVYASEAGTPLVADPGYQLARAAIDAGHPVRAAPGPSALLAALAVSGLPTDRFLFAGFLPPQAAARRRTLAELAAVAATVVIYESPKRVRRTLGELCETFGEQREAAVCRELTKRFEEVARGTLASLADRFSAADPRGEVVLVIDRAGSGGDSVGDLDAVLRSGLALMSVGNAASAAAQACGVPRRVAYARALALRAADEDGAGGAPAGSGDGPIARSTGAGQGSETTGGGAG